MHIPLAVRMVRVPLALPVVPSVVAVHMPPEPLQALALQMPSSLQALLHPFHPLHHPLELVVMRMPSDLQERAHPLERANWRQGRRMRI